MTHQKDEILIQLASQGHNIAQFASADNHGTLRHFKAKNHTTAENLREAVKTLLLDGTVNVRSYHPEKAQGCPFVYGLDNIDNVMDVVGQRTSEGLHVIVSETIDVGDGGVSGVSEGGIIEMVPGDTPRGVEKQDVVPMELRLSKKILATVYGFLPDIPTDENLRTEFSIHPKPRGIYQTNTIIWEQERTGRKISPELKWPNPFSRFIGDKAFGLIIAEIHGLPVPRTTVYHRHKHISPFTFGQPAGNEGKWTRTCPAIQTPGKFQTVNGEVDPYALMQEDDPLGKLIPSCLIQDGITPVYSGALVTDSEGGCIINGVSGVGDGFMQGDNTENLPFEITNKVSALWNKARSILGDVRFEWVYDGSKVWVVQLHCGKTASLGNVIFPGTPDLWISFNPADGLEVLREMTEGRDKSGIIVTAPVGMTSHVADILRSREIPSYIKCWD